MLLFLDTETTGIPRNYNAPREDSANWPRVVQLAYALYTKDGLCTAPYHAIVRPEGFVIPEEATRIHGIGQLEARLNGVDLDVVLKDLAKTMLSATYVVGHNVSFDTNVVGAEFHRHSLPDPFILPAICTMKSTTNLLNIPGPYGPKYPKLQELYAYLFNAQPPHQHNTFHDMQATARCYFELINRGVLALPPPSPALCEIHPAL